MSVYRSAAKRIILRYIILFIARYYNRSKGTLRYVTHTAKNKLKALLHTQALLISTKRSHNITAILKGLMIVEKTVTVNLLYAKYI